MKKNRISFILVVALTLCALCLLAPRAEATDAAKFAATVDGVPYDTLQEAINNAGDKVVIVYKDGTAKLKANLKIDLNGCNVTLKGKYVVYAMDSATDSYDGTNAGTLTATYASALDCNGGGYLKIAIEDGKYQFHFYKMEMTKVALNIKHQGFSFVFDYAGSQQVKTALTDALNYGIVVATDKDFTNVLSYDFSRWDRFKAGESNQRSIALGNVLDSAAADKTLYLKLYLNTKDYGELATIYALSFKDMIAQIDNKLDTYSTEDQKAITEFVEQYGNPYMLDWELPTLGAYYPKAFYTYGLSTKTVNFAEFGKSAAEITKITHTDGKNISYSVKGDVVTFKNDSVLTATPKTATGKDVIVVIHTKSGQYRISLKVCTFVIRTTDDFYYLPNFLIEKKVEGYYALAADLDFTGLPEFTTFCGYHQVGHSGKQGWLGTFDGQGHVIKNLKLANAWSSGIFGSITKTGVVKNVAFIGAVQQGYGGGYLANHVWGTIENVFIEGYVRTGNDHVNTKSGLVASEMNYEGASFKNITVISTPHMIGRNYALTCTEVDSITGKVIVICPYENKVAVPYYTFSAIKAANSNFSGFKTVKEALAAGVDSNGSTRFVATETGYQVYFGETLLIEK